MLIIRMRINKGFTLIELLVVTSIIATIVAGTSFGLINVLKKGRDTARISNVTSIQTTLEFYLAEHKNFDAILASDGVNNGSYTEAVYYSTSVPSGAGSEAHPWSILGEHLSDYSESIPVDPQNDYDDWVGAEPNYSIDTLSKGYVIVRLRSATVEQPVCNGNIIRAGYLIETALEDEGHSKTDMNREPRLFGCIAGTAEEHLYRAWGGLN